MLYVLDLIQQEALLFDEDEIRDHYIKIVYDNHDLTMFPYSSKRKSSVKNTLIKYKIGGRK